MASLKQRTVSGVKWQVINKVLQKVLSVATFAVLARMLDPHVFGIFAMAFVAIDGIGLFKSSGIDSALVHRKGLSDEANDTAFFMMLALGIVISVACYFAAPLAGLYFQNEKVESVVQGLAVVLFMGAFGRVSSSLLTKAMRFKLLSIIELIGAVANSVFAIGFAFISPTVWSLVWAYVIKTLVMTALTWYFSGYRLRWHFSPKIAGQLMDFGKFMLGLNILGFIGSNLGNFVIGRILGATALGYFALATNIGSFINTHFTQLLGRVMFPAYAILQEDKKALKRAYLKTVKFVSMLSMPFAFSLILLSKEFVLTLYGEKWLAIVPLVQILGIVQIVIPVGACSGSVYMACGKPKYAFHLNLWTLSVRIPLMIWMTKNWGLMGAVCSPVIMQSAVFPINLYLTKRLVNVTFSELFKWLSPSFLASLAMASGILAIKLLVGLGPRILCS